MQHPLRRLILATVSAATAFLAFGPAALADDVGNYIPPNMGFYDVPNQGPENVPGDFCGGDGSIGDVIPDGMFRAYVTQINDHEVGLDLICVYRTPQDDTIYEVPDGYVTNNKTRVRWMPINDGLTIHGSAEATATCTTTGTSPSTSQWTPGSACTAAASTSSSPPRRSTTTTPTTTTTAAADPGSSGGCGLPTDSYPSVGTTEPPLPDDSNPATNNSYELKGRHR